MAALHLPANPCAALAGAVGMRMHAICDSGRPSLKLVGSSKPCVAIRARQQRLSVLVFQSVRAEPTSFSGRRGPRRHVPKRTNHHLQVARQPSPHSGDWMLDAQIQQN